MTNNLEYALEQVYIGTICTSYGYGINYWRIEEQQQSPKYLEIPIKEEVFEVPILAFQSFLYAAKYAPNTTSIVAKLCRNGGVSRYKTAAKALESLLRANFGRSRLVTFKITQNDETSHYYITHGAVFNEHFQPIMMCSWKLQKVMVSHENGFILTYKPLKPILRISPSCFLSQSNPLEKTISKKMPSIALINKFTPDFNYPEIFSYEGFQSLNAEVIIGDSPFKIVNTKAPTINTTDSELLEVAKEHIDEIVNHDNPRIL